MARLQQGRKYGFSKGWLEAVNIQVGTVDVTTSGSSGNTAVTFEKPFKNTPTIILKTTEDLTDAGILSVSSPTNEGFTARIASGPASDTLTLNWMAIDNRYPSRRGGFHSGYVKCMNIQSGYEQLTTDGGGDGTALAITFKAKFKNVPIVLLTVQEAVTGGKIYFSVKPSRNGFTIDVAGSNVTNGDILVGWVAIDLGLMDAQGNVLSDNLETSGDFKDVSTSHRAGFRGGYVSCHNIQTGYNTIATEGSGDGTAEAITFNRRMGRSGSLERTPICFAEPQETDNTGNVLITSQSDTGFTLDITDSSVTSGNLTVGWVAMCTKAVLTD